MSATQSPTPAKARPFDNPRYSRTARATIAKWFAQMFPLKGVTETLLVARKSDEAIHDLYLLINNTLRILEAVQLAVLDEDKGMSKSDRIAKEVEIRKPHAAFGDEMKMAHRQDFDARKARRAEKEAPAERATA